MTIDAKPGDEPRVLWITGAGSGIGRAAALSAADAGWRVALSGRRQNTLEATADAVRAHSGDAFVVPVDVRDPAAVTASADVVRSRWGRIDGLVLAAGLNAPDRRWADQATETFDQIVQTNLVAPAHLIAAALPHLRERHGVAVIVSSYSAWTFSPGAGVAYSASKSALSSLARTVNSEEASSGVRACHLCPGDVNTDFLELRPNVPDAEARGVMLEPSDVARSIQFVLDSPPHVRFDEIVISPLSQR
ncbi:SDR family oxidoreductase [Leifsonia sp. NPDC058248]|uniref:SDR family oxidoreductase n=1 Tax=Leifsonia sp. NPDC058248 TaxID=3346402 RepID=UPI0036D7780E